MKKHTTFSYNFQQKENSLPRTDLACESIDPNASINGTEYTEYDLCTLKVSHFKVISEEGEQTSKKRRGSYITLHTPVMRSLCEEDAFNITDAVSTLLKNLTEEITKKAIDSDTRVLVAGLGNRFITPDSIGPKTVGKLTVTRHITKESGNGFEFDIRPVSAVAPGVLGITGIETSEILLGIAERVKPALIIAVDALASRKISRLGTTVQICDTGISPGSGVGNNRNEISEKTLGVPVVAIGVPMVVDAATMTVDAIETIASYISQHYGEKNHGISKLLSGDYNLVNKALSQNNENMVVTPNDVDVISDQASEIIAEGINMALF